MTKTKKRVCLILGIITILAIAGGCGWYFGIQKPYEDAVAGFVVAHDTVVRKNAALDTAIGTLEAIVDAGQPAYDNQTVEAAKDAIAAARAVKVRIPEMPEKTDAILAETEKLNAPLDYTPQCETMETAAAALNDSIQQMKQITNPPESFVIQCLGYLPDIGSIQAVTEENDPNGQLNKAGGYTAAVYFESRKLNQSEIYGDTLLDKGTQAGGCIEVYATAEEAEARNRYLSAFDGSTIVNPGSHSVLGTIVIRTSNDFTATQQKELEASIIAELLKL